MSRNGRGLENVLAANHAECARRQGVPNEGCVRVPMPAVRFTGDFGGYEPPVGARTIW